MSGASNVEVTVLAHRPRMLSLAAAHAARVLITFDRRMLTAAEALGTFELPD
jgi:hypothetical protein